MLFDPFAPRPFLPRPAGVRAHSNKLSRVRVPDGAGDGLRVHRRTLVLGGRPPARFGGTELPRAEQIELDRCVLGFSAILAVPSLRLARGLLFGVSPSDVTSFVAVAIVLAVVSLAATYIPARGASRADPMTLLREE